MRILNKIKEYADLKGDYAAYEIDGIALSYRELDLYSDRLAGYLVDKYPGDKTPLVVYGHKHPFMLVSFLACVKAGRAYCPVDISVPVPRVEMILELVHAPAVLAVEPLEVAVEGDVLDLSLLEEIAAGYPTPAEEESWVRPEDTFYIIFTSGSTGVPKGVQIPCECLDNYLDWSVNLGNPMEEKLGKVFLNQAPFSFDLSVMDLYTCLDCGGTLKPLDKKTQDDFGAMFERLASSGISVWVSTPSFADICLADPKFNQELMPELALFLFCGERLTNTTAEKLMQRFPRARVVNTYGPTESTVAMTEVLITPEICERENPLPVGRVKEGTLVRIEREDGTEADDGERGEILIIGNTVSSGYYLREEQTAKAFFETTVDGRRMRGYRTGDEGYMKDGMLYYCGRLDLQVKLHGYRIELQDIENNILRFPEVQQAVVVPKERDGSIKSLVAFVKCERDETESDREAAKGLQRRLKNYLPDYMVPKKMIFLDQIPMTVNGKADRRHLKGMLR